ncbi:hypothetical protein BKA70DRAFT_1575454 [Coprinopsis sp. MPI-PUGE-AT-0042]|nr:hypothetical protein BKA70DRAFT_1575454 [Coprinopsis sp. MPI-PUGE-AT-0042]
MKITNAISDNRPPKLAPYLSTNHALPPTEIPILDSYIVQLKDGMKNLERDISELQAILDVKKKEYRGLEQEYGISTGILHPIRRIPPEIMGHIFAFAVNQPPFNRFIDIARLRAVCSSWRDVALTTPGLWTSLTIDVDKWCKASAPHKDEPDETLRQVKQELLPWLGILDRSQPYHLVLTAVEENPILDSPPVDYQEQLVHYLLGAEPKPGFITINSATALFSTTLFPSACPTVTEVELTEKANGDQEGWKFEGHVFPSLTSFIFCGSIAYCEAQFAPSFLRTLHLKEVDGDPHDLRRILASFPSLQELNISWKEDEQIGDMFHADTQLYTHHSLETLILSEEGLIFPLFGFSFPCLRFLGVRGHGLMVPDHELVENDLLKRILARSPSEPPLLVSLRGLFFKGLLSWFIESLPPSTRLHLNVSGVMSEDNSDRDDSGDDTEDERRTYAPRTAIPAQWNNLEAVYCGRHTVGLWWISDKAPGENVHPLKIYLPQGYEALPAARHRRDVLQSYGLELEVLSKEAHKEKLRSMAPQFSKYSKKWWRL